MTRLGGRLNSNEDPHGYVTDIDYTWGIYPELAPVHLRWVASSAGFSVDALDRPFTYIELGCGLGATTSMLATSYPQGRFVGIDLNERQILAAREFAATGPLANVAFIAASIIDLDPDTVPDADFIVLHGVYAWVNAEVQRAIETFIAKKLKPGGVLLLSYNAMPGQALNEPIRRWMWEFAKTVPGSIETRARAAITSILELAEQNPAAFGHGHRAAHYVRRLRDADIQYVIHEYFNETWSALYFTDVARRFQPLGLRYAGDARLTRNTPELLVSTAHAATLREERDPVRRRFLLDYLIDESFHRDVWVRSTPSSAAEAATATVRDLRLGTVKAYPEIRREAKVPAGTMTFASRLDDDLLRRIADDAPTIGEILDDPTLGRKGTEQTLHRLSLLVASGVVRPFAGAMRRAASFTPHAASGLHREILRRRAEGTNLRALPSPVAGNAVPVTTREALLLYALDAYGPDQAPRAATDLLLGSGRSLVVNGQALQGAPAHLHAFSDELRRMENGKLGRFAALGLVESTPTR